MNRKNGMLSIMFGLVGAFVLIGCDQSKEALDSTRTQLTAVTAERDDLKAKVGTLTQQVAATQSQLDAANAKLAAAAAAPPAAAAAPAAPAPEAAAAHHTGADHHAAAATPKAAEVKKQEAVNTGTGHFNR